MSIEQYVSSFSLKNRTLLGAVVLFFGSVVFTTLDAQDCSWKDLLEIKKVELGVGNDNYFMPFLGKREVDYAFSDRAGKHFGIQKGGFDGGKTFDFSLRLLLQKGDDAWRVRLETEAYTYGNEIIPIIRGGTSFDTYADYLASLSTDSGSGILLDHYGSEENFDLANTVDTSYTIVANNARRTDLFRASLEQRIRYAASKNMQQESYIGVGVAKYGNMGMESIQRGWHTLNTFPQVIADYESTTGRAPFVLGSFLDKRYLLGEEGKGTYVISEVSGELSLLLSTPSHIQLAQTLGIEKKRWSMSFGHTVGYVDGSGSSEVIDLAVLDGIRYSTTLGFTLPLVFTNSGSIFYDAEVYHRGGYTPFGHYEGGGTVSEVGKYVFGGSNIWMKVGVVVDLSE